MESDHDQSIATVCICILTAKKWAPMDAVLPSDDEFPSSLWGWYKKRKRALGDEESSSASTDSSEECQAAAAVETPAEIHVGTPVETPVETVFEQDSISDLPCHRTVSDSDIEGCEDVEITQYFKSSSDESTSDIESLISEASEEYVQDSSDNHSAAEEKIRLTSAMMFCKVKHNLTASAVQDLCRLVNAAANKTVVPESIHQFKQFRKHFRSSVEIHHICHSCKSYIGVVNKVQSCPQCGDQIDGDKKTENEEFTFRYFPVEDQVRSLVRSIGLHNFSCALESDTFLLHDIIDGKDYKPILGPLEGEKVLTISFNYDGVPVFKSSSSSLWPVLFYVNELSPKMRKDNIMMANLWYGSKGSKPDMNVYLQPFVRECKKLEREGFSISGDPLADHIFVKLTVCVTDSVARPLLLKSVQFNGCYGCSFCLHPGERIARGKGYARAYPYCKETDLRTHASVLEHGATAAETGKACFGVKGISVLTQLDNFDVINAFVLDYMHSAILGVSKFFLCDIWLNSKSSGYIGAVSGKLDERLLTIKPTSNVSRPPRSVSVRKLWKAHEWYMWLLFYSPIVMKNILKNDLFQHWTLFVEGLYLLLGESISQANIVQANQVLENFVKGVEIFYGKENCTFNVHLCLHLADSVKRWGPLWAHSALNYLYVIGP